MCSIADKSELKALEIKGFNRVRCKNLKLFLCLYDVFYKDKSLFIVEEFIEGETLTDIFFNKEIQNINKVILMDILNSLKQVHREGYLLNDLSPDNIMIKENRFARFIDGEYSIHEERYTDVMDSVGTPGFFKAKYSLKNKGLYSFICICYFFFNRKNYLDFREEIKKDFIKKIDENPSFLKNLHIDVSDLLGMDEEKFFEKSYETKIEILEQMIKNY